MGRTLSEIRGEEGSRQMNGMRKGWPPGAGRGALCKVLTFTVASVTISILQTHPSHDVNIQTQVCLIPRPSNLPAPSRQRLGERESADARGGRRGRQRPGCGAAGGPAGGAHGGEVCRKSRRLCRAHLRSHSPDAPWRSVRCMPVEGGSSAAGKAG